MPQQRSTAETTRIEDGPAPPGPVTFLFSDIEGSTRLLQEAGDGYVELLEDHRRLIRAAIAAHGGQEVDTQAATVKQLEGTVMADRAAVGTAELNVGFSRIVAPVSGRLGLRVVDVGNYVGSGDAAGVAVITTVSPIATQRSGASTPSTRA